MKTRNSFVSNSSSSSYVIITSLENHNRVLDKLTDVEKKVIESISEISSRKVFDRIIVTAEEFSSENYNTLHDEIPEEYRDFAEDAWEKYQELVKENQEETLSWDTSF